MDTLNVWIHGASHAPNRVPPVVLIERVDSDTMRGHMELATAPTRSFLWILERVDTMCGYMELATALTGSFLWILQTRGYHAWIHGASHSP